MLFLRLHGILIGQFEIAASQLLIKATPLGKVIVRYFKREVMYIKILLYEILRRCQKVTKEIEFVLAEV